MGTLFILVIDIVTQVTLSSTRSHILMPWRRDGCQRECSPTAQFFLPISLNLFLFHSEKNKKNKEGPHGTVDYEISSKPISDARRLKIRVDNDPNSETLPAPIFNAESYAGAATELWAQKFCKKSFIPPRTGYEPKA